jgi:S1/P1 Nuclease
MPDSIVCSPVLKMRFAPRHPVLVAIFLAVGFTEPLKAYAPLGHEIVGAMADERLANTPTAAKIRALLNGMTLEKAAVIPDEIKGWDKKGVDDPKSFHYAAYRKIDIQLRDFWRANQPTHDRNSVMPSHHWFHYTDVPVMQLEKYAEGQAGRSKWDVVHMIPYCVEILQGRVSEQNERRITKPVAVILLAHYVGDIHQPLHVGAQYFGAQGRVADPDKDSSCLPDEGGNTFTLELSDEPPRRRGMHKKTLHGFWDYDAVNALFPGVPNTLRKDELYEQIEPLKKQLVYEMASDEPRNWRMPANLELRKYAEAWADEILPIAREAYERLKFTDVHPQQEEDRVLAAGQAEEKPMPDHIAYRAWATNVVGEELHKAGWRLADLLEKALR